MLNIRCFYCGKSFTIVPEVAAEWLKAHRDEKPQHYPAQCVFCRKTIKVPVKQIERGLPRESAD